MDQQLDIVAVVGSLRRDSLTKRLVRALIDVAPPVLFIETVPLDGLLLYNPDLDVDPAPQSWADFRARILRADAVLFATPEHNRSVPAALKNAIDVGSRPYGKSVWSGKPAAIVSASPGAIGGFGANHHLRQSLVFLNMPTMPQPEAYIGGVDHLVNDDGKFTQESTRAFMASFMSAFEKWISRFVS